MSPPAAPEPLPRLTLGAAALIGLLAGGLRFWQAGESLWLDELHTAWCATGEMSEVASRAAAGNQSPLFFRLEWLLVRAFGASEITVRLPSLIAGTLLPLAMLGLAWRWTRSSAVSLTAGAIAAADHTLIFYATEARPYALVQLLAVIHIATTAELTERPLGWLRVAWIALAALLFHLHYTAALLIPAELAFWSLLQIARPAETKRRPAAIAIDVALVGLLCLPALGNLQAIFARRENWAAFVHGQPLWQLAEWFPWALGVPLAIAGAALTARHRRFVCLALAWLLVPATLAWLATATGTARLFFPRYLMASAPSAILLAAICAGFAPWKWSKLGIGVLLAWAALVNSGIIEQYRADGRVIGDRNEDWRGAVRWLNERLPQQPYPVLVASGLIEADALREPHDKLLDDYCLFPVTALYPLAAKRTDLIPLPFREPWRLEPEVRQIVADRGGAWLVVRGSQQSAERIAAALPESGVRSQESVMKYPPIHSFGNIQVMLLTTDN